jgi:hypothetical protein
MGCVYVPPGSRLGRFGEALAWLWRLGPVLDSPDPDAVALGWQDEADELHRLFRDGELAAAAVFATRPGDGPLPGRGRRLGVASFESGLCLAGQFYDLDGEGEPLVRSSLGVHAIRDGGWAVFGADPDASWGTLDSSWMLPALADFIADVLGRPLLMLPPLGWVRYDDLPGTAYHQLRGRGKSDRKVRRRVEEVAERFAAAGARINLAIVPRAFRDGDEVPTDEVWPEAISAIRDGARRGLIEPVYHGYLHLDTDVWAEGGISTREFATVDRQEAERRLDVMVDWFADRFGAARRTFVAPTWAYSQGLLEALEHRGIATWLPAKVGPLVAGNAMRETVLSTLDGLAGLDYRPFHSLAIAGLPPTIVTHGGLFDARGSALRDPHQIVTMARLVRKRDLFRVPWVEGVRWVGATEMADRLRAHDQIGWTDAGISGPAGTEVVLRDRSGSRTTEVGAGAAGDRGDSVAADGARLA